MGSSYGGPIGLKLAVLYPDEFHHLVMLAPAIDPDKEKFWWFSPYANDPLVRLFLPRFINHATVEKFAHVEELKKLLPDWNRLSIPVTVVQGGADTIVDPENLAFAKKQLQGKEAEFIFLPNAGHLIRFQNAGLVKTILLKDAAGGTNGH
jgi:pimeloyl-ACP methyl ester carboxylesterase